MSAFRFLRQLETDGFLDESEILRFVHREELMRRWQAAYLRPMPETPLVFDRVSNEDQVPAATVQSTASVRLAHQESPA